MLKTPRFIILGANGYIGRHMTKTLLDKGYDVLAFDMQRSSLVRGAPYARLDITDRKRLEKIDLSSDFVIIFSGITGTNSGFENYEEYFKVNEIGLTNVLNSIRKLSKKPRVIFPSTRLVYKGSEKPIKEEGEEDAKTIYAVNKLACENILKAYKSAFDIHFTIFRICVPYGNIFDDDYSFGTIGFFLKNAKSGKPIVLYGDGSSKRTFTHIQDVCDQILSAGMHPGAVDNVYNLKGEAFSLLEAAHFIAKKYGVKVSFSRWPKQDLLIESGHTVFNSKRIEALLDRPLKYHLKEWVHSCE